MNHEQIDQFNLIDQYLMGRLPAATSASFEEHFVDCQQCLARLHATKSFLHDLRVMAAEQASQSDRQRPKTLFWQDWRTLARMPLIWAVAGLLVVAITGAVFVVEYTRHLRTSLNQAESLSEQWQRRYEEERQAADLASRKHQEIESQRAEQLRALEASLKDEEAQRRKSEAEFNQRLSPKGNVPIFILTSVRGGEPGAGESANVLALPRSSTGFLISIPLEGERRFENYRLTIFDDAKRRILQSSPLVPDQNDSLTLLLQSDRFRSGHFSLIVEGVKSEGGKEIVGNYPFQILKPPRKNLSR